MEYVIFAIDNNTDVHTNAKFLRAIDTARVMGKMLGDTMVHAIGYWEGILEPSFILTRSDYMAHAKGWAKDQECVLVVNDDDRQPAYVACPKTLKEFSCVGVIQEITPEQAKDEKAWTFNMTSGKYFVAK